jgi:hypothetical protein
MSADPEIMFTQMAAFAQPYFVESGIREKTLDDLLKWVGVEMATWSMQELMVVQLASAHFMSPLIGMALAQDKVDIAAAAVGCCGRFWQHKMNSLGGISFGDSNGYFPPRVDDRFCQNACLRNQGGDEDEPDRERAASEFPSKCGVGIVMDVMRRFATYGRNLRTGNAQLSH